MIPLSFTINTDLLSFMIFIRLPSSDIWYPLVLYMLLAKTSSIPLWVSLLFLCFLSFMQFSQVSPFDFVGNLVLKHEQWLASRGFAGFGDLFLESLHFTLTMTIRQGGVGEVSNTLCC